MKQFLVLSFALLVSFQVLAVTQDEQQIEVKQTKSLGYLIALPEGYDPNDKDADAVPLVLFLHGAGERGDDLELVKKNGPPKMIENGHKFDAIFVSPQCPADSWWPREVDILIALLDKLKKEHRIDKDRIYVTGLSMGGYGTFALAARQPERFAAAVPICGGGDLFDARRLTKLPMWVFHGDADTIVPLAESQRMVRIINAEHGENAKLTVYAGVAHNSWTQTYNNPAVWDWLFAQRRAK